MQQSLFTPHSFTPSDDASDGYGSNCYTSNINRHPQTIALKQGDCRYYPNWLPENTAANYYTLLQHELPWRQDNIKLFGKAVAIPRLQVWMGEPHCYYTYSNLSLQPKPWHPLLCKLADELAEECKTSFNCVLANWYRDGQDSMSMHADDEPELGQNPVIASLSLGTERTFILKHKKTAERVTVPLGHGSVLVMQGTTQQFYVHGINKTKRINDGRINLTFRYIAETQQCK